MATIAEREYIAAYAALVVRIPALCEEAQEESFICPLEALRTDIMLSLEPLLQMIQGEPFSVLARKFSNLNLTADKEEYVDAPEPFFQMPEKTVIEEVASLVVQVAKCRLQILETLLNAKENPYDEDYRNVKIEWLQERIRAVHKDGELCEKLQAGTL